MGKQKFILPHAAVDRLARVQDDIMVSAAAVDFVIQHTEADIIKTFKGAIAFTKHRNGSTITQRDIESYYASIKS